MNVSGTRWNKDATVCVTYSISMCEWWRVAWNGIERQSEKQHWYRQIHINSLVSIRTWVIDSNQSGWTLICNQMNLCRMRWLFCSVLCFCFALAFAFFASNSHGSILSFENSIYLCRTRFFAPFAAHPKTWWTVYAENMCVCFLSATVLIRYAKIHFVSY